MVAFETARWFGADELLAGLNPVTIFCGGFGSGKTEVAVNFALHLAGDGRSVSLADLDIVNPYFRSREVRAILRARGLEVLVPEETLVGADLPIVQPEIRGALERKRGAVVIDLGGDPVGSRVMASMADSLARTDYDGMLVLNSRRPFTDSAERVARLVHEIEDAARFRVTGTVVNSHLIDETTPETIEEGIGLAEKLQDTLGVRLAFVAVQRDLLQHFDVEQYRYPVMVLDRLMLKPWEDRDRLGPGRFKL